MRNQNRTQSMNIKKAIKARGWTIKALAEEMKITQPSLTSIVNGNPTLSRLMAVADAMKVPVYELLKDAELGSENAFVCPYCGKPILVCPKEEEPAKEEQQPEKSTEQ